MNFFNIIILTKLNLKKKIEFEKNYKNKLNFIENLYFFLLFMILNISNKRISKNIFFYINKTKISFFYIIQNKNYRKWGIQFGHVIIAIL